jgi:dolichol-phosphate mannosyltransferase
LSDCLVIIPTYNEKENIERMIRKVMSLQPVFHLLVVDDNSPDGTGKLVQTAAAQYPNQLFLLERRGKDGLGTAYIDGFRWALERPYQYIFEMDADFSHNPDDLVRLSDACKTSGADLAIGSRYITGVNVVNWPMGRVLLSYFASVYVRIITGMQVRDATAGFKCYKRRVLEAIDMSKIRFTGYAFQIEMKYLAWKMGFSVKEIPIIFTERQEGSSKISKSIVWEAVFGVIGLRLANIGRFRKKKNLSDEFPH